MTNNNTSEQHNSGTNTWRRKRSVIQQAEERTLERWVREYENDPEFIADGLSADVVEDVLRLLEKQGHNQTWLGDKMGVSRERVSRLFKAPPNLTLLSIARLSVALGVKPKVLLDSGNYFTTAFPAAGDVPFTFEEYKTEAAIQAIQRAANSTADSGSTRQGVTA